MAVAIAQIVSLLSSSRAASWCRCRSLLLIASAPLRSPRPAAPAAASNWSVTLAIAETTTALRSPLWLDKICATLL